MDSYQLEKNDGNSNKTIFDLPDHFVLSVINQLNLKQRIKCSRVCKKWNTLCKDPSIWSRIDIREYKRNLSLDNLKKIITNFGSESLKELLICGNFTLDYVPMESLTINELNGNPQQIKKLKIDYIDEEFIYYLVEKCPNLSLISLEYLNLSSIQLQHFLQLKNLQTFSLRWCNIESNWFSINIKEIDTQHKFSKIQNLYLVRTGLLEKIDIENICIQMPYLITLTINQAVSSLGDDSIEIISTNLIHLKQLDLINTIISDNAIFSICSSTHLCSNLTRLNLTMSSKISNNCLNFMSENLKGLETLYLTSCFGISNISFLLNLKNLIYLNINNTSIDKNRIKEVLLPNLPKCEVEYGHEKMLNRKLMWTINNSRNSVCSF